MPRFATIALVLALVGCSSSTTLPANDIHSADRIGASGGAIAGAYSGTFTLTQCGPLGGRNGDFTFAGTGAATFLHQSKESGRMSAAHGACLWNGSATLASTFHPNNTITVHLNLPRPNGSPNNPCHVLGETIGWTVTSGTGKFANASGRGSVALSCNQGSYTDTWSGTLTF